MATILAKSYADVLTILSMPEYSKGITSKEIFKAVIQEIKDTEIVEPEHISKINFTIRSRGFIATFDGNKEKLHSITPKGRAALEEYLIKPIDESDKVLQPLADDKLIATPNELGQSIKPSIIIDDDCYDPAPLSSQTETNLLNKIKELGYTVLDPADDLHAPFIEIVRLLEVPVIANKSEKIAVLSRLGNMLSDDLKATLDDIINDFNQLEESHA